VNLDRYKQRLLDEEKALTARIGRAVANARVPDDAAGNDVGDQSADDERRDEQLTEADTDSTLLNDVRDALARIENGTFGQCLVDFEPIEQKRLDAVPWTRYCLKHQELLETSPGEFPGR
jgi:DnaK suppressor protein